MHVCFVEKKGHFDAQLSTISQKLYYIYSKLQGRQN